MFKELINRILGRPSLRQREALSNIKYKRWQREKVILEQEQEIREEKQELKNKFWKIKLPFAKTFAIFLFVNFTILEAFTVWVTIQSFTLAYAVGQMPDFSPLLTLLGAIMGQTLSYWIYSSKAKAENMQGGIVYDMAMYELQQNQFVDDQGNVG